MTLFEISCLLLSSSCCWHAVRSGVLVSAVPLCVCVSDVVRQQTTEKHNQTKSPELAEHAHALFLYHMTKKVKSITFVHGVVRDVWLLMWFLEKSLVRLLNLLLAFPHNHKKPTNESVREAIDRSQINHSSSTDECCQLQSPWRLIREKLHLALMWFENKTLLYRSVLCLCSEC